MNHNEMLAAHQLSGRPSMSWHMAKPGTSAYAYSVTWTPGTLIVAGDIGDLTVNHWHAMKTLPDTLEWLDGIDFQYMMEKSTTEKRYDEDKTRDYIIEAANEQAIESMKALREEWREYRRIRAEEPDYDEKPAPLAFFGGKRPPDGWELWHGIWHALGAYGDPNAIFTADRRADLKHEMADRLHDANDAGAFCYEIGLSDFYGAYEWPWHCRLIFAAILKWRSAVLTAQVPA